MTNKPTNCLLGGALGDSLGYPVASLLLIFLNQF